MKLTNIIKYSFKEFFKPLPLIITLLCCTVVGIFFIIYEAIVAIPLNVLYYIRDKLIPAYKDIIKSYKDNN